MKNRFFIYMLSAVAMTGVFVSCDDDDDKKDSSSDTPSAKSYLDVDGKRLTSVGSIFKCMYDDNGDLLSYSSDYATFEVSQKPFKLVYQSDYSSEVYELKFNSLGYISSVSNTYSYKSDNETENAKTNATITYNKNGQVDNIKSTYSGEEIYKGESDSWSGTIVVVFTYSGSVLTKVKSTDNFTYVEDGQKKSATDVEEYTFEYDSEYDNTFFQYTPNYANAFVGDDLVGLAFIGMFGKASSKLPSSIKYVEIDDDEEYEHSGSCDCSYSYMSNGAIKRADNEDYTYSSVSGTRAVVEESAPVLNVERKANKRFGLMGRHHHRK